MNTQQIWKYLFSKKIAKTHPFDRDFIWVKKDDFESVKKLFQREPNIFHEGSSYRVGSCLKHIHAVEKEEYFFVHFDYGNHKKFLPFIIIHFFVDVIPWFIFCFLKGKRYDFYFNLPNQSKNRF